VRACVAGRRRLRTHARCAAAMHHGCLMLPLTNFQQRQQEAAEAGWRGRAAVTRKPYLITASFAPVLDGQWDLADLGRRGRLGARRRERQARHLLRPSGSVPYEEVADGAGVDVDARDAHSASFRWGRWSSVARTQ
jgi:hypothetical protein